MKCFMTCAPLVIAAAVAAWAPASGALAAQPGFDCARADGAVEELICSDDDLAALDVKLSEVFDTALRQHEENNYEDPRPFQRGWIKGRNECWKAEDMRGCVETEYKHRIAQLQIAYGSMVVPTPVTYACGDFDLAVVFYRETDPPTAVLTPIGRHEGADQVVAYQVPAGSGARYEGPNAALWEHHGEARLTWFGKALSCAVR